MKVLQFAKLASVAATLLLLAACDGTQFTVAPAVVVDPVAGDGGEDAGFSPGEAGHPDAIDHDAGPWPEEAGTNPDAGPQVLEAEVDAGTGRDAADAGDAVDAPIGCADDLSDVRGGDFHVVFDVLSTAGAGPLLEQRAACNPYYVHWLVAEQANDTLIVEVGDGTNYTDLPSITTVNDGAWHHVVVARLSGTLSIAIDGQVDNSIAGAGWSLAALPTLQVGRSACSAAFAGQIKNVCVARQ